MEKTLVTLLLATTLLPWNARPADGYSIDATLSPQKEEGKLSVVVAVNRLAELDGKLVEQLVCQPRILTAPGVPATLCQGLQRNDPGYSNGENVKVEVSWPYPDEPGVASCIVSVNKGDNPVSRARWKLNIEGPGRAPLVLAPSEVDSASVKIEQSLNDCVLMKFSAKTEAAVKKLAVQNGGNKVQLRTATGRLADIGTCGGRYEETGIVLRCDSHEKAQKVAEALKTGGGK